VCERERERERARETERQREREIERARERERERARGSGRFSQPGILAIQVIQQIALANESEVLKYKY
jgi:hypothetical protein